MISRALARIFAIAVFLLLAWRGIERSFPALPGVLPLQLTLEAGRTREAMPLVTTGVPHASDFFYVLYTGPTTVQFAYDTVGATADRFPRRS